MNDPYKLLTRRKKICQVEGKGTVAVPIAHYWFKKFNEGDMSLEDNEISDRPSVVTSGAMLKAIETNPSTSTRSRLSDKPGICKTSVFPKPSCSCQIKQKIKLIYIYVHVYTISSQFQSFFNQNMMFINHYRGLNLSCNSGIS